MSIDVTFGPPWRHPLGVSWKHADRLAVGSEEFTGVTKAGVDYAAFREAAAIRVPGELPYGP